MTRTDFSDLLRPSRLTLFAALLATVGIAGIVGCATSGSSVDDEAALTDEPGELLRVNVPPQAREVERGRGTLTYVADESGIVYLYDLNANNVVGHFNVQEGQTLLVSGNSGRATLAGNEVATDPIRPGRTYVAYFLPLRTIPQDQRQTSQGQGFRIIPDNPRPSTDNN